MSVYIQLYREGEAHIYKLNDTNMRISIIFSVVCLLGVIRAAPATDDDDETIVIPKELFDKSLFKYKAEYDIVEVLVPLNAINFDDSDDSESKSDSNENFIKDNIVFFVEADIKNGERIDHGLYIYKNGHARNILPTGRTAAATSNNNKDVYFGASDGLYVYDADSDSAIKYGPITDGIISIAVDQDHNIIYILTDNKNVYKVSNKGETKELVNDVEDAQEIVLDDSNNIYYYNSNKEVFIRTANGVIPVQGLPPHPKSLKLIRPPFVMEEGVPLMFDDSLYIVYANGKSEASGIEFTPDARPTAYGPEAVLVQYYAFNKRLYEYSFMQVMTHDLFEDIRDKTEVIRSTATRTKNILGSKRS